MLDRCKKVVDVQSLVERPEIYILASCDDIIAEKLSYVEARREDLLDLSTPITLGEVKIFDTMRFFQGILYFRLDKNTFYKFNQKKISKFFKIFS